MTDTKGEKRLLQYDASEIESKKPNLNIIESRNTLNNDKIDNHCVQENVTLQQECAKSDGTQNIEVKYFNGIEISKLSKRQMKKYKKSLKWQDIKKDKRAKERIKTKEKRIHAKLNNIDLGPSRKELKKLKTVESPCKIGVCIDLSFDELMIDKDMAKTIKQILRVYTHNRRAKAPMQLHLTNFNGRSKEEMSRHHGYENWNLNFHSLDYLEVFPKDKLIYLSSESDNIITKLQDDKIYIIGGLVDHNAHKGLCYNKAVQQGIAHAQLPIGEYFWMKHRKVLTINQVFEILLGVSEGKSFKEAFELILPKRIEKKATDNISAQDTISKSDNSDETANGKDQSQNTISKSDNSDEIANEKDQS